jgi:predicted N-acetyltransferase YhbS
MMTESARSYFVAEDGNEIVGMIMIRDQNYISQFFVSAQHQSKGIGGTLWRLALNSAMANGATGEFKVDSSLIARPIYESLGFAIAGEETVRAGFKFVSMHRPAASAA